VDTGEKRPTKEREAGTKIMIRLLEQILELASIFKEANRNLIYIFILNKAG
jgi:hypothetical protein